MSDQPSDPQIPAPAPAPAPAPQPAPNAAISIGIKEIMLAMGGVVVTVAISVTSWFFGNIHARLDKHETRIQIVEKDDVEHSHEIESLKSQSVKQWERLREQGEAISRLQAKVGRGQ